MCCVALSFDKGADFAIDKPAGLPCPQLDRIHCKIHEALETNGFSGCAAYQCTGAGQRTIALFDGVVWQDEPALLRKQMDTFQHLRALHRRIELLEAAGALHLPDATEEHRKSLLAGLCPPKMTRSQARALATGPRMAEADGFVKSLADLVTSRAATNPAGKT